MADNIQRSIKQFLKLTKADPKYLAMVDVLFGIKWNRAKMAGPIDLGQMMSDQTPTRGLIWLEGQMDNGWVRIAIQTENREMLPGQVVDAISSMGKKGQKDASS